MKRYKKTGIIRRLGLVLAICFAALAVCQAATVELVEKNRRPIYRRSAVSDFYVYRNGMKVDSVMQAECPKWDADSVQLVYVKDNNLFVRNTTSGAELQITTDGKRNIIINGKPDWVYEEEFSFSRAFDISADSRYVAWIRFDESAVPTYSFPVYPDSIYTYKYPKAGEENSKVRVMTYDIHDGLTRTLPIPLDEDGYIPRIFFTHEAHRLAVCTLNRHQNMFRIYLVDVTAGTVKKILEERNERYLEESIYADLTFNSDGTFILWSERSGYQHLYLYDMNGRLLRQLTHGDYDVSVYYGTDRKGNVYYASHEASPLEQNIFKVSKTGKVTCLTPEKGWHTAVFDDDMRTFNDRYSDINTPYITYQRNARNGKILHVVESNDSLCRQYAGTGTAELFRFTTTEGVTLDGWMLRPADFDSTRRYPVLMYQYGGPGSQEVQNSWSNGFRGGLYWEREMAKKGYIVVCVDGRGTGARGEEWKKCTYMEMGEKESRDQVETALWLARQSYVDADRIAIWGWSFGGFNTLLAMSDARHVFRCGVAVAPVTDWRFYDTVYTERFMRTPQENSKGYDIGPLHRTSTLSGTLLLVHGLADDNVHFKNTAEYQQRLVMMGYPFGSQYYTNKNHSILGKETRDHLFQRIERFLDENMLTTK
ncbi:MAG: S9 family peptidase [Prevotella sp.]|nr:S9 family peptidase [Candidatus Equicola faecalis]